MENQVSVADQRTVLSDFLPADTVKSMDDKAIGEHYTRFSTAGAKHFVPKADPNKPWYGDFQDAGVKDWLKAYGDAYPNAEAIAIKARSLEQFLSADKAGRGIILPKPDAKPEEWMAFYAKAGAGDKIEAYKLTPEQEKNPALVRLRDHAFNSKMPVMHFNGLMQSFEQTKTEYEKKTAGDFAAKVEKEWNDTMAEWEKNGTRDANVEYGKRAAAAFIPHENPEQLQEVLDRMEGALGTAFTLNFWARIGTAMAEHGFVGGEGTGGQGGQSAEAARMEIKALTKDPEFAKKMLAGDAEAKKKWDDLHKVGYPGE